MLQIRLSIIGLLWGSVNICHFTIISFKFERGTREANMKLIIVQAKTLGELVQNRVILELLAFYFLCSYHLKIGSYKWKCVQTRIRFPFNSHMILC